MLIIGLRKGKTSCSSACPFYAERGVVRGCYDVPLKTHCRMTMNPWIADCNIYDGYCIDKMEVTEEQWMVMQKAVEKKATRQQKLYPEENEMGRPVGSEWTEDRWNAQKSAQAKQITNYRQLLKIKQS